MTVNADDLGRARDLVNEALTTLARAREEVRELENDLHFKRGRYSILLEIQGQGQ